MIHFSTVELNAITFCGIRWVISVLETVQVELDVDECTPQDAGVRGQPQPEQHLPQPKIEVAAGEGRNAHLLPHAGNQLLKHGALRQVVVVGGAG